MATLVQMRTRVRDWLSVTSARLPDSYCNDLINDACREIYRNYDLRFNETLQTSGSTVAGTATYALPATFSRVIAVRIVTGGDFTAWTQLNQLSYGDFIAKYGFPASTTSGDPVDFAIASSGATPLMFGPTPSRVNVYYIDFYEIPADLTADGDVNSLLTSDYQPVLYKALAKACKFMLEDDRSAVFEIEYQAAMRNLLTEHNRTRWSGKATPQMIEPM